MEITIVKAADSSERDRVFLGRAGHSEQAAVHVEHDLAHLVVESLFELPEGLWASLAAGQFSDANRATTARDPRRRKRGHIVSPDERTEDWLTDEHRLAKRATNSVMNRWGDGPDTAAGVRVRLSDGGGPGDALLGRVSDETIDLAIRGTRALYRRWHALPPGGTLHLSWPLSRSTLPDAYATRPAR